MNKKRPVISKAFSPAIVDIFWGVMYGLWFTKLFEIEISRVSKLSLNIAVGNFLLFFYVIIFYLIISTYFMYRGQRTGSIKQYVFFVLACAIFVLFVMNHTNTMDPKTENFFWVIFGLPFVVSWIMTYELYYICKTKLSR